MLSISILILIIILALLLISFNKFGGEQFNISDHIDYPYLHKFWTKKELHELFDDLRESEDPVLADGAPTFGILELDESRQKTKYNIIAGNKYEPLVDYFQEEVRVTCNRRGMLSPLNIFKSSLVNKWASEFKHLANKKPTKDELRIISKHMRSYKDCDLMSANVVKRLMDEFKPRKVLMPTGGWGDAIVAGMAYDLDLLVAVDPNKKAVANWYRMLDEYMSESERDNYKFIVSPFEDVSIEELVAVDEDDKDKKDDKLIGKGKKVKEIFDMVYSSPPYFISEEYSKDKGQSLQYSEIDQWFNKFLAPSFEKAWSLLRSEGHMIIIVNDVIHNGEEIHFVQRFHDFVDSLVNASYLETWAFKKFEWQKNYQPIFIWEKL